MKKHKYLASFPSDRWERLKRDAKRRGVSYNVVINDALDDSHMRYMYGNGLFEDLHLWHDSKEETPESKQWLILVTVENNVKNYYIGIYDKMYLYINSAYKPIPDFWMYIPELEPKFL